MLSKKAYIIPFAGLKTGLHSFDFQIKKPFFDAFEHSIIDDGSVAVTVEFSKSDTMLVLWFSVEGNVTASCDRCLDDLSITVNDRFRQVFTFSENPEENFNDEITVLPESAYELDVAPYIYDFIHLSLPSKTVHEEGDCNPAVIEKLSEYLVSEAQDEKDTESEEEIDPRWSALKQLRNK